MKINIFCHFKRMLVSLFFLMCIIQSFAQLDMHLSNWDSATSFYNVRNQMNSYLDSLKGTMDSASFYGGGGEYKEWKIFDNLWQPRADSVGSLDTYFQAQYDYYNNMQDSYSYFTTESWRELGPKADMPNDDYNGIGPAEFISFFDNGTVESTNYMLTGSTLGGLFYSTDAGENWSSTGTDNWEQSGCASAVFHPSNHRIWYAASSGNGASTESMFIGLTGGVFRTIDEGQNWVWIADYTDFAHQWNRIFKVLIDPISPTTLFTATKEGLYKTTDCHTSNPTWIEVLDGFVYDMEYKPGSNTVMYATAFSGGAWKVYYSNDSGNNWQQFNIQPPGNYNTANLRQHRYTIEVSKAKPDYLYCATREYSSFKYFYLDIPNATSWTLIDDYIGGQMEHGDGHGFGVDQNTGLNFLTSKYIYMDEYNINSGYIDTRYPVHVDVEDIIFHPYNNDEVWACTHGGVEKSIDGGQNWITKYNGLGIVQVEQMATSFSSPDHVMTGLYHDGSQLTRTPYSTNWNPEWEHVYGGDGMKPVIDNNNPNNMWASGQQGAWAYSSDKFQSYTNFSSFNTAFFQNVGVINKQNSSIFFWNKFNNPSKEEVYRSDGYGPGGTKEFISDFSQLFPNSHQVYILGLVTPFNNGDYLIAFLHEEQVVNNTNTRYWHLLRTTNANGASVGWTELIIPTNDYQITSVEFHPENPDIIYLSYVYPTSGYNNPPENMIFKIDYSDPLNPITTDLTGNLPYTIARSNCLAAVSDFNDGLFFATEFGVFYTNSELQMQNGSEWKLVGTEIPHCHFSGIEINYYGNCLRAGTYGRGIWELSLPCILDSVPINITVDTTWNNIMRLDRSVIINAGSTLTISSDALVGFVEDAKLIIQPGGKLILDGGTLTNACGDQWQGIEVWGNPNASQIPANQGVLQILNNGTIENAEVAIRVGSEDYTGKGGGMVYAQDAVIQNNDIGVWFDPYNYQLNNESYFYFCTFGYDLTLTGEGTFTFVKLDGVDYVYFKECDFINNSNLDHAGYGIYSTNATFTVDGGCTDYSGVDCIAWSNGLFENLQYGVYATTPVASKYADIRHTDFTGNFRGVYLSGMTLPRVTSNNFTLDGTAAGGSYGLYLDACTDYWVEDNTFEGSGLTTELGIGIVVNESGKDVNLIYGNAFNYVEYAINVQGNNRNDRLPTEGLEIRCNYYDNTLFDETVIYDGMFIPASHGIASQQGRNTTNVEDMAGNIFYYETTATDYDDLNNQSNHFYYYYSSNASGYNVEPLDYTTSTVTIVPKITIPWIYENACPSNLTAGGSGGSEGMRSSLNEAQAGIEATEAILITLIDGGDTETLNAVVETSTPPEASAIYNELMGESPNLSETVVETSIDKEEVLPNVMIRDIMVANPHTSTSFQLLDKLDERTNPMPAWMKAQILAGRSIQSLKTELEGELAGYKMAKCKAINSLARYFGQMPENPEMTDSLLALYQSENTISSRYLQACLYLQSGQYQQGQNIMDAIPVDFTLMEEELTAYQNMQWLYTLMAGLLETGNDWSNLNEPQIAQLLAIVDSETGFASVYARNILLAMDAVEYLEPVLLPKNMKSTKDEEAYREVLTSPVPSMLEVYPNPSKDYVIIGYQFDKQTEGVIEVRDVSGRLLKRLPVKGISDQVTLTTRDWNACVYILSLIVNEQVIETTKFTLVK